MSNVTSEQQLLQNTDKKIESLELKLSEYITIMQTTSNNLYNCQKAHWEENVACNNVLLLAHRDHQTCYLVYLTLYQQYQWFFQDFKNLVTSNLQLQNKLAALHDSNQNIKTEKTGQTSSKKQELVKAEVQSSVVKLAQPEINMIQIDKKTEELVAFTSTFNSHKSLSANFFTEDKGLMLQEHTQKKRFSDGDEGLTFAKKKKQVKKP